MKVRELFHSLPCNEATLLWAECLSGICEELQDKGLEVEPVLHFDDCPYLEYGSLRLELRSNCVRLFESPGEHPVSVLVKGDALLASVQAAIRSRDGARLILHQRFQG